jgi:hypothetical protein
MRTLERLASLDRCDSAVTALAPCFIVIVLMLVLDPAARRIRLRARLRVDDSLLDATSSAPGIWSTKAELELVERFEGNLTFCEMSVLERLRKE